MAYERFTKLDDEKHDRIIKSLIGMNRSKFDILATAFAAAYVSSPARLLSLS